jgi:TonB family protein
VSSIPYPVIWLIRLAAAVVLSFLLLTGVSLLHAAMGFGSKGETGPRERRVVASEVIRKQAEEKKTERQRVRQVKTTASEGKSDQGRMAMRFSPDLSLDASAGGDGAEIQLAKQELGAEVFNQGQTDEDAVPEFLSEVPYPDRARDQGIEGEVEVLFVVTHLGRTSAIDIVRSPSPLITAEVRRTVATWKFKPARNKGIPVNQRWRRIMTFKLD